MKSGQLGKLLNYLETHPSGITQLEAFNTLGICRLSERVRELEGLSFVIEHRAERTVGGARVIRYLLVREPAPARPVLPLPRFSPAPSSPATSASPRRIGLGACQCLGRTSP